MTVMTAEQFVAKATQIAQNYKTLYVMGCFGSPLNASNKSRYTVNHSYNKRSDRTNKIRSASADTFGFDCVCLIKGILWGWSGNKNTTYGGARYGTNGVPDVNADAMMNYCTGVSTDFRNIAVGEVVHMTGHIGIYIGNGLVVECTPIWKDGVQITACGNIGKKAGYNTRTWTNHGKLKFIKYSSTGGSSGGSTTKKSLDTLAQEVIAGKWGNGSARKNALTNAYNKGVIAYTYAQIQARVDAILNANKATYHIVRKGENLTVIAHKYGTTVNRLVALNGIKNPNIISIGQRIRVK